MLEAGPQMSASGVADLATINRSHIHTVLEQKEWQIGGKSGAAQELGIPPSTLRSMMQRLGISRPMA